MARSSTIRRSRQFCVRWSTAKALSIRSLTVPEMLQGCSATSQPSRSPLAVSMTRRWQTMTRSPCHSTSRNSSRSSRTTPMSIRHWISDRSKSDDFPSTEPSPRRPQGPSAIPPIQVSADKTPSPIAFAIRLGSSPKKRPLRSMSTPLR